MLLDSRELNSLRRDFQTGKDGLNLTEFVAALLARLSKRRRRQDLVPLVANLVELFAQVDVDGNGDVDWDEWSAFCIEAGALAAAAPRTRSHPCATRAWVWSVSSHPYHWFIIPVGVGMSATTKPYTARAMLFRPRLGYLDAVAHGASIRKVAFVPQLSKLVRCAAGVSRVLRSVPSHSA